MTEIDSGAQIAPKKGGKAPLLIGIVLAGVGGAGGYFAVTSGMLPTATQEARDVTQTEDRSLNVAFIPVDPIVVSMQSESSNRHLQFRAQLEVPSMHQSEVSAVLPRIVDVLNSYLRALEARDLEGPTALTRLRAQMLRRIQIVTGQDKVNNLLIMEFVVN